MTGQEGKIKLLEKAIGKKRTDQISQ